MILHINKKKESKKKGAALKSILIMATYLSTVYVLDYQAAFSTEKNTRYLSSKGYRIKKKKPASLSEQGFYDGTYQELFPDNFTPYSKQQPRNILSQSSITDKDFFIKNSIKEPINNNESALKRTVTAEKNKRSEIKKEDGSSDLKNSSGDQTKEILKSTVEKTTETLSEKKNAEKNENKELTQIKDLSESASPEEKITEQQKTDEIQKREYNKKNQNNVNNNSEHIEKLEKRLVDLEKKLLEKKPSNHTVYTEEAKEKKTTLTPENKSDTQNKSDDTQTENQIDEQKNLEKSSDVVESQRDLKGQILSFIYVQGTERPKSINYAHKGSKHSLDMNTEKAKKILSNITSIEQVLPKHPKDSSSTFTHNPLLTTYQDIQKIENQTTTQETLCIFRNGPYFITFDFKNPQKKNPSLNAGEIYVYNQLFDKSFSKKSYYIQSIKKENNEKVYLGKIIDTGTTVIPGDTICITQDILFSNSEDFIKNSMIGEMKIPPNTPASQNDPKPTPVHVSEPIPVTVTAPTVISTSAQKQIISQPQKSNSQETVKPLAQNNAPTKTNSPTMTNIQEEKDKKISLLQDNNTPSLRVDTPSPISSNTPQNNTSPLPQIINNESSKSSKYDIRI